MERRNQSESSPSGQSLAEGRWLLGVLASIGLAILAWCPLAARIEFGGDEGYELQKAFLLRRGLVLYCDVWNDQPPLHSWVLSLVFRALGEEALWGRLISLGAALWTGMCVGHWARQVAGTCSAALVVAVLFGHSLFFLLGTSAMLEMPTVAAALTAVNVAGARCLSGWQVAVVAGVIIGLAAQVKLTALLYIPSILCLLWLRVQEEPERRLWRQIIPVLPSFLAGSVASFVLVALAWPGELDAILPHLAERMRAAFADDHAFRFQQLAEEPTLFLIAALLPLAIVRANRRHTLPFLVNFATTFAVLGIHRPYWDYYLLHLLVPCAVLAAIPIQTGWESFKGLFVAKTVAPLTIGRTICLLPFIYCLVGAPAKIVERLAKSREPDTLLDRELLSQMKHVSSVSQWAFSIRPIFAFHTGLPTPPHTTVIPEKRVRLEEHVADVICDDLEHFQPGPVYLFSHLITPRLQTVLDRDYQLVFRDGDDCLFLRKNLLARVRAEPSSKHISQDANDGPLVKRYDVQ